MQENIDKVMQRGERIDDLRGKTGRTSDFRAGMGNEFGMVKNSTCQFLKKKKRTCLLLQAIFVVVQTKSERECGGKI